MLRDDQLQQLTALPPDWRFALTGSHDDPKVAFEAEWNAPGNGRPLDDVVRLNRDPRAHERWLSRKVCGLGALTGPESGGLLVIDFDGRGSEAVRTFHKVFGRSPKALPQTISNTSGKKGRGKVFLRVPHEWWPQLENRSASWRIDDRVVMEAIWQNSTGNARHAVVVGDHPDSSHQCPLFFRWLPNSNPEVAPWALAPDWLLLGILERFKETSSAAAGQQELLRAGADDPTPWQLLITYEKLELVKSALEFCPTRDGKGSGTYEKVRRILCGLINEFGLALAGDIVMQSQWNLRNDWGNTDALAVMGSLSQSQAAEGSKASIRSLFHFAREHGFQWPRWALPIADTRENVEGLRKLLNLMNQNEDDPCALACLEGQARREYGVDKENLYRLRLEHFLGGDGNNAAQSLEAIGRRNTNAHSEDVIEGLLARRVYLIAGASHSGKTTLCSFLANRVVRGLPIDVGRNRHATERPGRVLFLTSDQSDSDMVRDLALEGVTPDCCEDRVRICSGATFNDMLRIVKLLSEFAPDLVVMDCLASMGLRGVGIGDPAYADPIRLLVRHNGVSWPRACFVVLHHTTRDEPTRFSGTEQIKASCEELVLYYPPELLGWRRGTPRPQIGPTRVLSFEKSRGGYAGRSLRVTRNGFKGTWHFEEVERQVENPLELLTDAFRRVTDDEWRIASEWHSELELPFHPRSLRRYLDQLEGTVLETAKRRSAVTGRVDRHFRPKSILRESAKAMIYGPGDGINTL